MKRYLAKDANGFIHEVQVTEEWMHGHFADLTEFRSFVCFRSETAQGFAIIQKDDKWLVRLVAGDVELDCPELSELVASAEPAERFKLLGSA